MLKQENKKVLHEHHSRELSYLSVDKARGNRKCSECKGTIKKDSKLLKGWNLDQCSHKLSNGRIFSAHIKLQFCITCANKPEIKKRYEHLRPDTRWDRLLFQLNYNNCMECPNVSIIDAEITDRGDFLFAKIKDGTVKYNSSKFQCGLLKRSVEGEGIDNDCPFHRRY